MKNIKIENLLKFKRTEEGYYEKEVKGKLYSVRQNEKREWHLYLNGYWHLEVENCKDGKLRAIADALGIDV
jgi:hypothetical protein